MDAACLLGTVGIVGLLAIYGGWCFMTNVIDILPDPIEHIFGTLSNWVTGASRERWERLRMQINDDGERAATPNPQPPTNEQRIRNQRRE